MIFCTAALVNCTEMRYDKGEQLRRAAAACSGMKKGLFPMEKITVHDTVKNVDLEVTRDDLIQLMKDGRQVDFVLKENGDDCMGCVWDTEYWSLLSADKFIRTYSLNGKVLGEYTHFNKYDMATEFDLARAKEVRLS